MDLKDLELVTALDQSFYDGFNSFMLSSDLKVFGKLLARTQLFDKVKDIPGDIVECGVFKGTGLFTFLKLKRYFCPNTGKKIIGFDFFDSEKLTSSLSEQDREAMTTLFEGRNFLVKELTVNSKSSISLQKHHHRSEHWMITQGKPLITINKKKFLKNKNETVFIPQGTIHRIENNYKIPVKIIEIQTGAILKETDIVRYQDVYGRVK